MPNKNYEKGRRFEYKVRDYLRNLGLFVVRQAKSAFPDLIAINTAGDVAFIECKVAKYLTKTEKEELNKHRLRYGVSTFVAYPVKIGRRSKISFERLGNGPIRNIVRS